MLRRFCSLVLILLCCSNFFFTSGLKKKLAVKNKTRQLGFPIDIWVYIKALNKGLCLTDKSDKNLTQEKCTNADNQKWRASENSDGTFTFCAKVSERAWDVKDSGTIRGTPVITNVRFGGPSQRFYIERFKLSDYYMFKNKPSNKCLDTQSDRDLEGISPIIYDCSDENINQGWKYEKV